MFVNLLSFNFDFYMHLQPVVKSYVDINKGKCSNVTISIFYFLEDFLWGYKVSIRIILAILDVIMNQVKYVFA